MTRFHTSVALCALLTAPALAQDVDFVLGEIVFTVNAAETESDRTGTSVVVIDEADLAEAGDQQLAEYLSRLPGITLTQGGPMGTSADLGIRGAQGRYISVYIDGILVTDPSGTSVSYDDFGGLGTGSVRRVEILRGTQSALYGGTAVGGVISITTHAADLDGADGQTIALEAGSHGHVAADYGLAQTIGDLSLRFGASIARADGFSAAEEDAGNPEADGFERRRLSFGARYAVSDSLEIGLNGFWEDGRSEFDEFHVAPTDGSPGDDFDARTAHGLRAHAAWQTGDWEHVTALSGYAIARRGASLTLGATAPGYLTPYDNRFEGQRLGLDHVSTGTVAPGLTLSFGLNAMHERARYDNLTGGSAELRNLALFAEAQWAAAADYDLTATLRHDSNSRFGDTTTGRFGVAWRPVEGLVLRGAMGTGFRPPSLDELFGDYPEAFFVGNPGLLPEDSLSAEIGADYTFAGGARIGATLFRLDVENLIVYCSYAFDASAACPDVDIADPGILYNVPGVSTRRGVELTGALPLSDALTLTGAYTRIETDAGQGARLSYVPRHDLVLGLDAAWGAGWSGSITARRVVDTVEGGGSLPDYTLVNASLGYEIAEGIEAYLRVHNLGDAEYQTRGGYGTSDRAFYVGLRASF